MEEPVTVKSELRRRANAVEATVLATPTPSAPPPDHPDGGAPHDGFPKLEDLGAYLVSFLDKHTPGRHALLVVVTWAPCAMILIGYLLTMIVQLLLNSFSFVIAACVLYFIFTYLTKDADHRSDAEKSDFLLRLAAVGPVFMVEVSSDLSALLIVLCYVGVPIVIRTWFPYNNANKNVSDFSTHALEIIVSAGVIFSIAAGGTGLVSRLVSASCFVGGVVAAQQAWPKVRDVLIGSIHHPVIVRHQELLLVALQLCFSSILMVVITGMLPAFCRDKNNLIVMVLWEVIGIAGLFGGFWLTDTKKPEDVLVRAAVLIVLALFVVLAVVGILL